MLYTAQHLCLACIEVLVHVDKSQLPRDYVWSRTELPAAPMILAFESARCVQQPRVDRSPAVSVRSETLHRGAADALGLPNVYWRTPVRIFKNKSFTRFAKAAAIDDVALCRAIRDAEAGLACRQPWWRRDQAADRAARPGQVGRVSSADVLSRNDELVALRKLAAELLGYDDGAMARVVASGILTEVMCDE